MSWISDLIGLIGLAMLGYGLYLINLSLALSVIGALLIVLAVCMARKTSNDTRQNISSQHKHVEESQH